MVSAAIMAEPLSSKECTGAMPFLKSLAQAVTEFLGSFSQIPLGMAAQAGVIIDDPQQHRINPLTFVE